MAKKSKKRARQAARRAERREEKRAVVLPEDTGARLLNRIFREAQGRHEDAAYEKERLRAAALRREERARARGKRPQHDPFEDDRFEDDLFDNWLDDWLREE